MLTLSEFEKMLRIAIGEEQKAQNLYLNMIMKAKDPVAKAILEGLREEEQMHEKKLEKLLASVKP